MAVYKVLKSSGDYLTSQRLRAGKSGRVQDIDAKDIELRGAGLRLDEEVLEQKLDELLKRFEDDDPVGTDAVFSQEVRDALDLSRREASDTKLWTYLNLTVGWEYIVWRWEKKGKVTKSRVNGNIDRSALARLWWMAELSRSASESGGADDLEVLTSKQDVAVALYERPRLFGRSKLAHELLRIVAKHKLYNGTLIKRFAKESRAYFGVRIPALMDPEQLRQDLDEIAAGVAEE